MDFYHIVCYTNDYKIKFYNISLIADTVDFDNQNQTNESEHQHINMEDSVNPSGHNYVRHGGIHDTEFTGSYSHQYGLNGITTCNYDVYKDYYYTFCSYCITRGPDSVSTRYVHSVCGLYPPLFKNGGYCFK